MKTNNTMFIDPKSISGKTFTSSSGVANVEYTCIGYGQNETFLIIGSYYDSVNNRSTVKTFKFGDVQFKGNLAVTPP